MFIALLPLHSISHPFQTSKNQTDWPQSLYCLPHSHSFTTPHHDPHWCFWICFVTVVLRSGRCYLLLLCTLYSRFNAPLLNLAEFLASGRGVGSALSIVSPNNCLLFPNYSSPESSSLAPYATEEVEIRTRTVQPVAQSLYLLSYPPHIQRHLTSDIRDSLSGLSERIHKIPKIKNLRI